MESDYVKTAVHCLRKKLSPHADVVPYEVGEPVFFDGRKDLSCATCTIVTPHYTRTEVYLFYKTATAVIDYYVGNFGGPWS